MGEGRGEGLKLHLPILLPQHDEDEAKEHAAQVGEVGNAGLVTIDSGKEFEDTIADDQPLGFQRHRREEKENLRIGEHHAKGQQDAKHRTRGTHRDEVVDEVHGTLYLIEVSMRHLLDGGGKSRIDGKACHKVIQIIVPSQLLDDAGTDARHQIIDNKTLFAPNHFEQSAKHIEGEHIVEQMDNVAVHEHIGDHLPPLKFLRPDVVQSESVAEVDATALHEGFSRQDDGVDDDEMKGDIGDRSAREICHFLGV